MHWEFGLVFLQFLHNHPKNIDNQEMKIFTSSDGKIIETPDFSGKVIVIYFFGEASIKRRDFLVFGLVNS